MIIPKLAVKNIRGAGTRTWLNAIALSFAFVSIIFLQGLYNGMNNQVERATVDAQYGGGQYWHVAYDPLDPLTISDAHGLVAEPLQDMIDKGEAVPILIRRATIYPHGRFQNAVLKGITVDQKVLSIPSAVLVSDDSAIPGLIGSRMARSSGLAAGDYVTVRWRDVNGTFDAHEVKIVEIMRTDVPEIDNGQIWVPVDRLRQMTGMRNQATIVVLAQGADFDAALEQWVFRDLDYLLQDLHALFWSKTIGGSIYYLILLFLAMLAIFDTQILSIFRRRKEMGTMMAMGMTRSMIIRLFTLEGALHAILAAFVAALYGLPLLWYVAKTGYGLPQAADDMGLAIGNRIFPSFSLALIIGSTLLVLLVTTIVSYLPTRKIAKLKPTDALRGKLT